MRVVLSRTVVGYMDRHFDNLSGSHHQSHVNCVSSVYGNYVILMFGPPNHHLKVFQNAEIALAKAAHAISAF